MLPARGDKFTLERDWSKRGDTYLKNVGHYWKSHDWIGDNTYLWVWDEPGNKQETKDIPAIDKLVHQHVPGAKAFATAFPYERTKDRKLCKKFGNRACHTFPGQKTDNTMLWNGGDDDLDAWLIAAHRYYGKWTSGLEQQYRIDHTLDAYKLQQKLRARGKEVWSYTYFMPTKAIPQLTIDGPPTDPRLLMLWNGYEANKGWLTWHMNRWVDGHTLNAAKAERAQPVRGHGVVQDAEGPACERRREPLLPAGRGAVRAHRPDGAAGHLDPVRGAPRRDRGREPDLALPRRSSARRRRARRSARSSARCSSSRTAASPGRRTRTRASRGAWSSSAALSSPRSKARALQRPSRTRVTR